MSKDILNKRLFDLIVIIYKYLLRLKDGPRTWRRYYQDVLAIQKYDNNMENYVGEQSAIRITEPL